MNPIQPTRLEIKTDMKKIISLLLTVSLLSACSGTPGVSVRETDPPETVSRTEITFPVSVSAEETTTVPDELPVMGSISEETTLTEAVPTETTPTEPAPPTPPDTEQFDREIAVLAEKYSVPGMSLCVFADGEILHSVHLGYADTENEIPCDGETVYRVASVSKLISAIVLMTLYDRGEIDPYTDLEELTGLPYNFPGSKDRVLLWHLMTHTAGFTDSYAYEELSPSYYYDASYVMEQCYTYAAPGEKYNYCNFGAGMVGSIVEILTGEFFHDYADSVLFSKLDMNAAYCADLLKDREKCANLYEIGVDVYSPKTWGRSTAYYERFGLGNSYLSAQCELLITAADLARLGILLSGDGSVDGVEILSRAAVDAINTSYTETEEYELGLHTRIYPDTIVPGRTIYGHPGFALGNICGLYYDPSDGTGIALCTNSCYSGTSPNGVYGILDESIKLSYRTFFDR